MSLWKVVRSVLSHQHISRLFLMCEKAVNARLCIQTVRLFATLLFRISASHALNAMRCSDVAKQRHETKVHVLLHMAMEERQSRLVGDQIHGGASKRRNDHCV